jgi:hypothetical protein
MNGSALRHSFAALFLLVLLAEWSAHAVVHIGSHKMVRLAASSDQGTADDPCHSFVHCRDGRHRDRQMPNISHDVTPNMLVDMLHEVDPPIDLPIRLSILFTGADGLSRPPDPSFHPPELVLS